MGGWPCFSWPFSHSGSAALAAAGTEAQQMGVQEVKLEEKRGGLRSPSFSDFPALESGQPSPRRLHLASPFWSRMGGGAPSYFSMFPAKQFSRDGKQHALR